MKKIYDFLPDVSLDDFWSIVDNLPDEVAGKEHKKNVNKFFGKNGDPTNATFNLKTDEDFQEWHDTTGFIRRFVRKQVHVMHLKLKRNQQRDRIKRIKESRHGEDIFARSGRIAEKSRERESRKMQS